MAHLDTPEKRARQQIDNALREAGWHVQSRDAVNLNAGKGVAVREFQLRRGYGYADYLLYVDGQAVGAIEAKKEGDTLTGVEVQSEKYAVGMPDALPALHRPLPFLYQSTGVETRFTNRFEPEARSGGCSTSTSLSRWRSGRRRTRSGFPTCRADRTHGATSPRLYKPV